MNMERIPSVVAVELCKRWSRGGLWPTPGLLAGPFEATLHACRKRLAIDPIAL